MGPFLSNDPRIEQSVKEWLNDSSELFVERYIPHSGGSGIVFIIRSTGDLSTLLEQAKPNSAIFISRKNMLPLRGGINDEFIALARTTIAEDSWWILAEPRYYPEELKLIETGNTGAELQDALAAQKGQRVWLGPDYTFPDTYWEANDDPDVVIIRKGID